jgi:hypothetical protein
MNISPPARGRADRQLKSVMQHVAPVLGGGGGGVRGRCFIDPGKRDSARLTCPAMKKLRGKALGEGRYKRGCKYEGRDRWISCKRVGYLRC